MKQETPRIVLTLRCDAHCPYCPMNLHSTVREASGLEWLTLLRKIGGDSIVLTGGEPTLHPDFVEIVENAPQSEVNVYTNLGPSFFKKSSALTRKVRFYCSYHPHFLSIEEACSRIARLRDDGHTVLDIHAVAVQGQEGTLPVLVSAFEKRGERLQKNPDIRFPRVPLSEVPVRCTIPAIYFGPDARRYHCIARLELGDPLGVVADQTVPWSDVVCHQVGACSPCDTRHRATTAIEAVKQPATRITTIRDDRCREYKVEVFHGDALAAIYDRTETFYELDLLKRLTQLANPGTIWVDVGANVGNHALWALGRESARKVICVEPDDEVAAILRRNLSRNGFDQRFSIHVCAAGDMIGTGSISAMLPGNAGATRVIPDDEGLVFIRPLDDILALEERISVIKIDAEGWSTSVLHGALDIIRRDLPIIAAETWHDGERDAIDHLLSPFGYKREGPYCATEVWIWKV